MQLWIYLKDAQGATLRLSGLLSLENERTAGHEAAVPGNIEFRDVTFSYGGHPALNRVSFTVEKGKKTALVGFSGSGKSTALNLIEKFYAPQSGAILLNGTDITALDVEATAGIQRAIDEACRGRTQITVAHDLSTVRNADKILVFNRGRLEAQGTHEELLSKCPLYRELVKEAKAS